MSLKILGENKITGLIQFAKKIDFILLKHK